MEPLLIECFGKLSFIKPFFLSGGIGLEEEVTAIINTNLPVYAIDVNSKLK
jgi:phosphoribosylanthranilate isomerase